ncbi:MAG TPA: DMT family transporter [Pyrinomonadaceae bacterium]
MRRSLKPHVALVAVQFFFGTWPIVGKIALRGLPSTGLVAFRVVGAALAFIVLHRMLGGRRITRRADYARLALYSLLGVVLNQFFFVKGLALSTVINATLLGTTIPIATLLVSILLGRERPVPRVLLGTAVAACGVIYLVNPTHADFSRSTMTGNLLLVLNTFAYGAYIAISQDVIKRYDALTVIMWVFIFGCVAALPIGGYQLARTPLAAIGAQVWLAVLYIILVPTVGAYYLSAWALGRVPPSTVAVYIYLQPLIAFALAPLVLDERLNSRTGFAALLIFAGVALVTIRARGGGALEEVSERPEALGH